MASLTVEGRSVRVDPQKATVNDFKDFQALSPEKGEKKIALIKEGADTKDAHPPMPYDRSCNDAVWVVAFVVTAIAVLGYGYLRSGAFLSKVQDEHAEHAQSVTTSTSAKDAPTATQLCTITVISACTSLVAAMIFILLAHRAPSCVVWASLIFGPSFVMVVGIAYIAAGGVLGGVILLAAGALGLCVNLFCYKDLIPFMIQLTEVVSDVIEDHPCMMMVGFIGTLFGLAWVAATATALACIYYDLQNQGMEVDQGGAGYGAVFISSLIFIWGSGIASNICHVTYCGVFGHWYYKGIAGSSSDSDAGTQNALTPALGVALGSSLGSICLGSLLVAIVRAIEAVARSLRKEAQENGNPLLCVVGCILECIVGCIGDMLEYFNDWAYVQCAVRGVSFSDAAKITWSLMTCAHMKYIISDLLLNSVVTMGTIAVAFTTAVVTGGVAAVLYGSTGALVGAMLGGLIGLVAGGAALGIINSGVKTLLACWADDPEPLANSHPEIHEKFLEKLSKVYG